MHTTNYQNTLIVVADDCPATTGEIPPVKGNKRTIGNIQFELISQHPYRFTSDDILFRVFAERNDLMEGELDQARAAYFSKGQACLRASPLAKRYGWGIHHDGQGRVALYGCETPEYDRMLQQKDTTIVKAMKSSR